MSQWPSIIQRRIREVRRLPIHCLAGRSRGAAVFVVALMLVVPSIAQDAAIPEPVKDPVVQPDAARTPTAQPPSIADDKSAAKKKRDESETVDLLTDNLTQHWKVFNSAPATPETPVWKVVREGEGDAEEFVLICSGEPKGYLYTIETCSEFELTLEWKYPKDADGNSGVLVYTQDEPRIWPTSMQVQLHQPKAGSVFPSGDAMSDHSSEAEPDLARPVDTWNEGRIVSQGGRLSVEVNGKKAGEVSGAKPSVGSIALQSEGSVVHFRRIRLRKLPVVDPEKKADPAPESETGGACSELLMPGSAGLARWSFSNRGRRTPERRNSRVTVSTLSHRCQ